MEVNSLPHTNHKIPMPPVMPLRASRADDYKALINDYKAVIATQAELIKVLERHCAEYRAERDEAQRKLWDITS